jgi:hypothetical protein
MVKQLYRDIRSKHIDFHRISRRFSLIADEKSAGMSYTPKGLHRR